ncbi:MAG: hypothetical protein V4525_14195 [Pseudomonadota bacterium]
MFKKSLVLLSLLTFSNNIWAATFTNKSSWEASTSGVTIDEPVFAGCKGTVGAQSCTDYPNGVFTDTKVLGQAESFIQFD